MIGDAPHTWRIHFTGVQSRGMENRHCVNGVCPALALLCSPWFMWEQCGPMSLHNPGQLSLFLSMFLSYANPVVLVLYSTPFCSDLVSYHRVCHCFDLNQRVQRFIVPSIIDRYCLSIHRCSWLAIYWPIYVSVMCPYIQLNRVMRLRTYLCTHTSSHDLVTYPLYIYPLI